MKKLILGIDFEGRRGMPFEADNYDIDLALDAMLKLFSKYEVKVVFFVLGKLIEERSDIVKNIAGEGHYIAIHGYEHENLEGFDAAQINQLAEQLAPVEEKLAEITGKRPTGFRSPFLMFPAFYSKNLYEMLQKRGYRWISNRSIRHESEFIKKEGKHSLAGWLLKSKSGRAFLFALLNWRFLFTDKAGAEGWLRPVNNLRWLFSGMAPFRRYGLMEIPVQAPLDCDLLGLPRPEEATDPKQLEFAAEILINNIKAAKGVYTVTFHDWIIGTGNRPELLEKILAALSQEQDIVFISPEEVS
jgi:peptidoglycan/xylan/chitin deacetylase (PgdA/CDA1 family)